VSGLRESHDVVVRVLCDRCGNREIAIVTAHGTGCGCQQLDWGSRPRPTRWFEYEARAAWGGDKIRQMWPPEPETPEQRIAVYCEQCRRHRSFRVGAVVSKARDQHPGQKPAAVRAR